MTENDATNEPTLEFDVAPGAHQDEPEESGPATPSDPESTSLTVVAPESIGRDRSTKLAPSDLVPDDLHDSKPRETSRTAPDVARDDHDDSSRLYFVTNRFNLLTCLGARLVLPLGAYRKYYPDLLPRTPGKIPLITTPPTLDVLQEATGDAPNSFPVILEISSTADLKTTEAHGLVIVDGAIPWSRVERVHFPTDRALKEHAARPYGNVHPDDGRLLVSPSLFEGGNAAPAWPDTVERSATTEADSAANHAAERDDTNSGPDWNHIDRARGALNALRVSSRDEQSLQRVATVLIPAREDSTTSMGAAGRNHGDGIPSWLTTIVTDLIAARPDQESRPSTRAKRTRTTPKPDDILFRAVLDVLVDTDVQDAWSPKSVLERVVDVVADVSTGRSKATLTRNLDHIAAVVTGTRDFTPFKTDGSGLPTAKALLMVLLREDLGSLLEWPADQTAADPLTVQTAAVFAGALRGLSREKTDLRNRAYDDFTADVATGIQTLPATSIRLTSNDDTLTLELAGEAIQTVALPVPTIDELLDALSPDRRRHAQLAICDQLDWKDLVTTTVTWTGDVTIQSSNDGTVARGTAVDIRQELDQESLAERLRGASRVQEETVREVVRQP